VADQEIADKVGQNIRYWRKKAGMTQRQLAAEVNMLNRQISYIETGRGCTTMFRLVKIARALNVTVSALAVGVD